jgi:hypothetical protein
MHTSAYAFHLSLDFLKLFKNLRQTLPDGCMLNTSKALHGKKVMPRSA